MIELRHGITEQEDDYSIALMIGQVMLKTDIDDWRYIDYLPYMLKVLQYVEGSIKNETKKLKYTPTAQEKKAGIDKLNIFKEWGIVDSIAQRLHILHEQVWELHYVDVFLMQHKDLEEAKFQRRLSKIMTEK
jgi:hypothetical protein